MSKPQLNRDNTTITIAQFIENLKLKKYNFNPNYQRHSVWSEEKQSFFIDSIMKNFPVPPIFLRRRIDDGTGTQTFDVIDGKQRLEAIRAFVDNKIPVSLETNDKKFDDPSLAGKYFRDLDAPELREYKTHFWRYILPVEYVDTDDQEALESLFDRLNRYGEPLQGQELRNARHHSSPITKMAHQMASWSFWEERLKVTDKTRMEDVELASECIFLVLDGKIEDANQKILDEKYEKHKSLSKAKQDEILNKCQQYTDYLINLKLDYDSHKIKGVSHLYTLWSLARKQVEDGARPEKAAAALNNFFKTLRDDPASDPATNQYKEAMSSRTKSRGQRQRRLDSLEDWLGRQNRKKK